MGNKAFKRWHFSSAEAARWASIWGFYLVLRRLGACSSGGGFSSGDHLIVGTIAQPQRAMGTIVKDVKVLLESNPKWPFYFIPNSTNRVTHALASCALNNCFFIF